MKTDNGNVNCVVDTETTGLIAGFHEVIEIGLIILDENLEPTNKVFNRRCRPNHPERFSKKAQQVNGISVAKALTFSDPYEVQEEFLTFFEENVPTGKKFTPLGHNFCFDRGMLWEFFGTYFVENQETGEQDEHYHYDDYFFHRYRDSMQSAIFINDLAEGNGQVQVPFPKVSLNYLCNILGVENPRAHSALSDCRATAECYVKMKDFYLHGLPLSFGTSNAT